MSTKKEFNDNLKFNAKIITEETEKVFTLYVTEFGKLFRTLFGVVSLHCSLPIERL